MLGCPVAGMDLNGFQPETCVLLREGNNWPGKIQLNLGPKVT